FLIDSGLLSEHTMSAKAHSIIAFGFAIDEARIAKCSFKISKLMEVKTFRSYWFKSHKILPDGKSNGRASIGFENTVHFFKYRSWIFNYIRGGNRTCLAKHAI